MIFSTRLGIYISWGVELLEVCDVPNMVAILGVLSRIRNQVQTVRINIFLRLTCIITHKQLLCIIFSTSFTLLLKEVKKTCIFTLKWLNHLLLKDVIVVTIVADYH